jgi:peptidoglycan-associated lipoprotein
MKHRQLMVIGLALSLGVAACRKQPPPVAPPPAAQPQTQTQAPPPAANNNVGNPGGRAAGSAGPTPAEVAARATLEALVYFDYDQSDIRTDSESLLRSKVPVLQANPQVRIRIEGHADERGSTEYNLALGNRRAEAVRQFLVGFGIAADRFTILSYGEERPKAMGDNENAWSQNRRAEFVITAGGDAIRAP